MRNPLQVHLLRGASRKAVSVLAAGFALLLGLSTNLASGLIPGQWAADHPVLVWSFAGISAIGAAWLAMSPGRVQGDESRAATGLAIANSATGTTTVGSAIALTDPRGPVIIGADLGTSYAQARSTSQVIVGEIPGAPPTYMARDDLLPPETPPPSSRDAVRNVYVLIGSPGSGKTHIAAGYARRAAGAHVPIVAWISADDRTHLLAGLTEVARRLGAADASGDSEVSAARARDLLAARTEPGVIIFDNARDPALLRRYIPATGRNDIIVTSTDRAFESFGSTVNVDGFTRDQSVSYLTRSTGINDELGANRLAEALGDLPLAVAQAAAAIRSRGLGFDGYLTRLSGMPLNHTLPSDRGDSYPLGAGQALQLAIDTACDDDATGTAQAILGILSLLSPDGVSREWLTEALSYTGYRSLNVDNALHQLATKSLLGYLADHSGVVMHRLVGRATRERLEQAGTLGATISATTQGLLGQLFSHDQAWERRFDAAETVAQAISIWHHAVSAQRRETISDDEFLEVLTIACWTLRHLTAVSDLALATEFGSSLLDACVEALGPAHPQTWTVRLDLAAAHRQADDYSRAIELLETAVTSTEESLGRRHTATLVSLHELAETLRPAGRAETALQLHREVLAGLEASHAGPMTLLSARCSLARSHQVAGHNDTAVEMFRDVVRDAERTLGEHDDITVTAKNNLASTLKEAGDAAAALRLFTEVVAVRQQRYGSTHRETLIAQNNLADTYNTVDDCSKSVGLHTHVLETRIEAFGEDHPDTLLSGRMLAIAYLGAGDFPTAQRLAEEALSSHERVFGPKHQNTLLALNELGYICRESGDGRRAVAIHTEALRLRTEILGPDHRDTLRSACELSIALRLVGRYDEAYELARRCYDSRTCLLGAEHPATLTSLDNLGCCLLACDHVHEASSMLRAALEARSRVLGPDARGTVRSMRHLAQAYSRSGDADQAVSLATDAVNRLERKLGDHPETIIARRELTRLSRARTWAKLRLHAGY